MGAEEIGKLYVRIESLEKDFNDQMRKIEKSADATAKKASNSFKNFTGAVKGMFGAISFSAIGKQVMDIGLNMDEVQANFAKNTGLMGKDLQEWQGVLHDVYKQDDQTFTEAADLLTVLKNKLGLTADEAKKMAGVYQDMIDVFDVGTEAIEQSDAVLRSFGLSSKESADHLLDLGQILKQNTNIAFEDYLSTLQSLGPAAQALGMDLDQTTALIGMFASAGVDAAETSMALNMALKKIEQPEQLYDLFDQIKILQMTFQLLKLLWRHSVREAGLKWPKAYATGHYL